MNTIQLTKKLVSIPSFVEGSNNEKKLGEYIFKYLSQFSWLTVRKEYINKNRFNVIAWDKFPTKVLICDHIDTVQIQSGWKTNPFKPTVENEKIYGLGTSDSKGNIATLLSAIENVGSSKGLMYLSYVDDGVYPIY